MVTLAFLLAGCANPRGSRDLVPLEHFSKPPTVQLAWPKLGLTLPPSNAVSVGAVLPRLQAKDGAVFIRAQYVWQTLPHHFDFDLPDLGVMQTDFSSIRVYWINPDDQKVELDVSR